MRELDKTFQSQIILGMGTLTRPEQAQEAREAGAASFLVSPVCETALGLAMVATGLPVMIGAMTPTEVFHTFQMGSDVVRVPLARLSGHRISI